MKKYNKPTLEIEMIEISNLIATPSGSFAGRFDAIENDGVTDEFSSWTDWNL